MIPDIPHLPPYPQTPKEWFPWSEEVLHLRLERYIACNQEDEKERERERQEEIARCKSSSLYLMSMYGTIYEARPNEDLLEDEQGGSAFYIPFIPYPFQIRAVHEFDACLKRRGPLGDLVMTKCREMGMSNLLCFWVAHGWMARKPFQVRMLSQREEDVDNIGDPGSLFWKVETFLKGMPMWLLEGMVPGFRWKDHRRYLKFVNPANANFIAGESTRKNAGRGDRATVIIYDEAAFVEDFAVIWEAGRGTTRHRFAVSTASTENGMDFYNIYKGLGGYTQSSTLSIPYHEHPLHDDQWLREESERDTPDAIQREIFMNFFAGSTDFVYPEVAEKRTGDYPFEPWAGPVYVTMDDGFDDDFAIVWIQYITKTGRFRVFQAYRNSKKITGFYGSLLKGVPESQFNPFYGNWERAIMLRQQELPPITYTADAHLANTEQLTGESPMEYLAEHYGINAFTTLKGHEHKVRRRKLGAILPMMDFHEVDYAPEVLEAVQRYRFKSVKDGKDQMSEYRQPLHDKYSHYVTALEWFACNLEYIQVTSTYDSIKWTGEPSN